MQNYRHYRLNVVGRNRPTVLLHLALAVLLVGGWTAVALGLPVQAMSIVAEDDSADAPADDREEALTEEEEEARLLGKKLVLN